MQDGVVKSRIGGVPVRFPALIGEIELDAAAQNFPAPDPDRGVGKIRAGLAVPSAELHDLDCLPRRAGEGSPEVARKPARLQFQLVETARVGEKRALADLRCRAQLGVTFRGRTSPGRLKRANPPRQDRKFPPNQTRPGVPSAGRRRTARIRGGAIPRPAAAEARRDAPS